MSDIRSVVISSISVLAFAGPAYAYLDPGTASIILQGLIGGGVVAASGAALYWQRLKAWFKGHPKQPQEKDEEEK